MDLNDLRSAVTLVSLLLFAGICVWAWRPQRQAEHDVAANLPFVDGDEPPQALRAPSGGRRIRRLGDRRLNGDRS
jgi:cytochrome c oxidase cbb3-type subunit 4